MAPPAGPGQLKGQMDALLQERHPEDGPSGCSVERENCPLMLGLSFILFERSVPFQVGEVSGVEAGRGSKV